MLGFLDDCRITQNLSPVKSVFLFLFHKNKTENCSLQKNVCPLLGHRPAFQFANLFVLCYSGGNHKREYALWPRCFSKQEETKVPRGSPGFTFAFIPRIFSPIWIKKQKRKYSSVEHFRFDFIRFSVQFCRWHSRYIPRFSAGHYTKHGIYHPCPESHRVCSRNPRPRFRGWGSPGDFPAPAASW